MSAHEGEGFARKHGMAAECCGDIGDAALPQQVEGGIAARGEIGRRPVCPDLTGVLAERHVPDVMEAILDLPVPAPHLLEPAASACSGGKLVRACAHSARVVPAFSPLTYSTSRRRRHTWARAGQPAI